MAVTLKGTAALAKATKAAALLLAATVRSLQVNAGEPTIEVHTAVVHHSIAETIQNWAYQWSSVMFMLFFAA
ncbi:MAG TPA: hypothetical protein VGX16_00840, partial [Solirubrobacteraceae bacterium]|nr:hypothetical protein [Solirubrobacteraceae bacterium]